MKLVDPEVLSATSPGRLRSLKGLGIASVVAPTVFFCAYAYISYDAAFRNAEAEASHLSSMLQEHAQRTFETIELALRDTDRLLARMDDQQIHTSHEVWSSVRQIQGTGPQLGSVFVVAADGSNILTTRTFPAPEVNFGDRDYYLAQKDRDAGFFVGGALIGKISAAPIFNFSIRRSTEDGHFNGVIGSSAFVDYFQNFFATVGDAADEFAVLLLRADGDVLVRYPKFEAGQHLDLQLLRPELFRGRQVQYATSPIDGRTRLYATAKVGSFPIYVAYSIARDAIIRKWAAGLMVPGGTGIAITTALLLLTLLALQRARREGWAVEQLKATALSLKGEIDRRQKVEATLLQAQKLDAVGRLTSGIAHDFNNLLTIISGNLQLAQRRKANVERFIKSAEYATDRGAALVRQLLAFSRGQTLRPATIDLKSVLRDARAWITHTITEAIAIDIVYEPDLWPVCVDVAQFEAALLNLVVNARDAMGGRGRLLIKAHNVVVNSTASPPENLAPGEYAAISVVDTGCGMTPDVLDKIYEPFFTTKGVGKGTGLGLSQVHGFIRQSGGDISIDSKVGKGTTVTLYLPRANATPTAQKQTQARIQDYIKIEEVVLVVDDNDEVRKIIIEQLHDLGYCALAARIPEEALAILSAGERIDVLLTDQIFPRGSDVSALINEAIKSRPDLRVLLMTGSLELETHNIPVLRKPFSKSALQSALSELGGRPHENLSADQPIAPS